MDPLKEAFNRTNEMKQITALKISALSLLLLFHTPQLFFAQNIHGKILDSKSFSPIENVNIYLQNNKNNGTFSDNKGRFYLKLNSYTRRTDSVIFSILGYKKVKKTISNIEETNTILLTQKLQPLNEVTLSSNQKLNNSLPFKSLSKMPKGLYSFSAILVNGKIYVIGGDNSTYDDSFKKAVERAGEGKMMITFEEIQKEWYGSATRKNYNNKLLIYDIATDSWQGIEVKLENRAYHRANLYNNKIFILGGKKLSFNGKKEFLHQKIEIIDTQKTGVQIDKTNPHQAVNFASFVYKGNIMVLGGSLRQKKNGSKVYSDKIHQFNIKTGYWFEVGKMTVPKEVNGVLINDKIFLFGGESGNPLVDIESFDLITGKWENIGHLFQPISRPAVTSHDDTIYLFDDGRILIYDIEEKTLKQYKINLFLKNAGLQYYDGKLYIIGGYREDRFSKRPSNGLYEVDLKTLGNTKISSFKSME